MATDDILARLEAAKALRGHAHGMAGNWVEHYARDVTALLRANEALAKALREAQGCIVKHHNISSKRELGRLCPICVPADGSSDIFQIIDAALAGAETGAEGGE